MPDRYFIKERYAAREQPRYFADVDSGVTFQPDVYDTAAAVARGLGARRIVDVGTGQGRKLAGLHPQLEVVGIDFGPNLEHARRTYPFGTWIEADLDQPGPLPLEPEQLRGAVVVCADVIEHVQDPALLLDKLEGTLDDAAALLLSTPERDLVRGREHHGPPGNPCHLREWSIRELDAFLRDRGLEHRSVGLTRDNDLHNRLETILAVCCGDDERLDAAVRVVIDHEAANPGRRLRTAFTPRFAVAATRLYTSRLASRLLERRSLRHSA
jgi:SAM-dependent methyltransferase